MNIKNECIHCVVRQFVDLAERVASDDQTQKKIIAYGLNLMNTLGFEVQPAYITGKIYEYVKKETAIEDPFLEEKETFNEVAKKLIVKYDLRERIARSSQPLETAIRLSIAGNIIDFSLGEVIEEKHVQASIESCLKADLYGDTLDDLIDQIKIHDHIMILGDNAGEIVFDHLLIETIDKSITYVVKGGPVVNDATRKDALSIGLDKNATIIDTGASYQGVILEESSEEFKALLASAPLVICKGQANYECLNEYDHENMYFLLRGKCQSVAEEIGCSKGAFVCVRG